MASNILTSVFAIIAILIIPSNGQVNISPSVEDLLIKEGSTPEITCKALSEQTLDWSFPGTKDGLVRNSNAVGANQKSVIKIHNFTSSHAGEYTCAVQDGAEVFSDTINLVPVIETKVEPAYHFGNETAVLTCSIQMAQPEKEVGAHSIESVTWMKNDQPVSGLPESARFVEKTDSNSLIIKNPKREDTGVYTASIKVTGYATPYSCNVTFQDEVLQIKTSKVEPSFDEKQDTAVLSCNINTGGRKVEKVEWLKNDTLLSKLDKPKKFEVDAENNSLIIKNLERADADLYVARFTIEGMTDPYNCQIAFKAGPKVSAFKKSKNLIEKDNLELLCEVTGYPRAVVTWYKDNKALNFSQGEESRIKMQPRAGYKNAHLIIKEIEFEDAGEYTCEAFSAYFNESSFKKVTVRVKDKLAALWPFLGIVCEVIVLCAIIFVYEKRRNKQAEQEEHNAQEADGPSMEKKDGLRHRNTPGNPGA